MNNEDMHIAEDGGIFTAVLLIALAIFATALTGCVTAPMTHGIPNFSQVDYSIFRGGQPNAIGWMYLKSIGVTNVVKLNDESEGSDRDAAALGMVINYFPISLQDQIFYLSHRDQVWNAVDAITPHTYIHCEHGQDRTGLIVACYRVENFATRESAEQEMLAHGFHKELFGLWHFWETHLP